MACSKVKLKGNDGEGSLFETIPSTKCVKQMFPSPDITVTYMYTYFNKPGYFSLLLHRAFLRFTNY
jgi:hypothetical protein